MRLTKWLFGRLMVLVGIYQFMRLGFMILNWNQFQKFHFFELAGAFLVGLRFDVSAVLMSNLIFILMALVPFKLARTDVYQKLLKVIFIMANFVFIGMNLADIEYYKFTDTRLNKSVLFLGNEAANQVDQFIVNYWHLSVMFAIVAGVVWMSYKPWQHSKQDRLGWLGAGILRLLVIEVAVIGIRGGLQTKPLKTAHAFGSGATELGILSLNSTFTFLTSKQKNLLQPVQFYSEKDLDGYLPRLKDTGWSAGKPENVVLIILESFATEFIGKANSYKGYTPFLDQLIEKSLYFPNNMANARKSIEALPAILFGIPSLMATPLAKSNYQSNRWYGLGRVLSDHGYHTSFFHAARKGTMYFDAISSMAGLKDYYPLERYPHVDRDFDGNWGLFDEPFLQYMASELGKHPQPFFSTVFTISTHQPYHVPEKYKDRFKGGDLKIHASVQYVDFALERFFEAASQQGWYENTLFVITADHTQMSKSVHYNSPTGRHMVPLIFYHPTKTFKHPNTQQITQHSDIYPSVLDYLDLESSPHTRLGRSVFDSSTSGDAVFFLSGNYWLVKDHLVLHQGPNGQQDLYDFFNDRQQRHPLDQPEDLKKMSDLLKAYIQQYNNGLAGNTIYSSSKGEPHQVSKSR